MFELFAADGAVTDGGVVGGIIGGVVTAAGALYVIWDKWSRRTTEARREALADEAERQKLEEQDIKLDDLARKKIAEAYEQLMHVRKAERDEQIARLTADIAENKRKLAALESREQACQELCASLHADGVKKDGQIAAQAKEIAELRAHVAHLESKLKQSGALPPGTDVHVAYRGPGA